MSITSFDHFVETLDNVPAELQKNFNLMADLDKRNCELINRINECVRNYWKTYRKDDRISLLKESMDLFDKARSFSDDKIDLAMQTYDLVDKHIRRLEGISTITANPTNNQTDSDNTTASTTISTNNKKKHDDKKSTKNGLTGLGTSVGGQDGDKLLPALTMDMPLDPNEPRYCTCHQVSFGEMIACDNKDCPIEWFHFACVDLKTKPKGKWYCPECFNVNKKVKIRHKKTKA